MLIPTPYFRSFKNKDYGWKCQGFHYRSSNWSLIGLRVRYFAPDGKLLGGVEADTKIEALWLTVVGISLNK